MKRSSPAFQFYPKDWLSSEHILIMTPAQEGAYIRLLALAWLNADCSLPDDDAQLAALSRLGEGWFNGGSGVVRACFTVRGDRLVNVRLLSERKKQAEWRKKSSDGGKKSANNKRDKKLHGQGCLPNGSTNAQPKGNSSSSVSSSVCDLRNTDNPPSPLAGGAAAADQTTLPNCPAAEPKPKAPRKPRAPKPTAGGQEEFAVILAAWNERNETAGLPPAMSTASRLASFRERWADPWWRENWRAGLDRMCTSRFCRGDNNRNWHADMEFFLRPDSLTKIMEGKYDDKGVPKGVLVTTERNGADDVDF